MKEIINVVKSKQFLIGLGVGIAGVYVYKMYMNKENTSSASGDQIGSRDCGSPNNYICAKNCQTLGGTFNPTDRKCYENGVAISGGLFGERVSKTKFSSACGCGA